MCLRRAGLDSAHTRCPTPPEAIDLTGACRTGSVLVKPLTITSASTAIAGKTRVSSRFDMAGVHTSSNPEGVKYSALGNIDSWTSPVFLAQGDDDMNVNFNEGTIMARALQAKRPAVTFLRTDKDPATAPSQGSITKEYFEEVYKLTNSPRIAKVLEDWEKYEKASEPSTRRLSTVI